MRLFFYQITPGFLQKMVFDTSNRQETDENIKKIDKKVCNKIISRG